MKHGVMVDIFGCSEILSLQLLHLSTLCIHVSCGSWIVRILRVAVVDLGRGVFVKGGLIEQGCCELLKSLVVILNQLELVMQTEELLQRITDLQVCQQGHASLRVLFERPKPIMKGLKPTKRPV